MRYLIAGIVALVCFLIALAFVGQPVASLVVDQFTFESPDEVSDLHTGIYLLTALVGLLVGWAIGWLIGGRFVRAPTV